MKLKDISRTATFAWDQSSSSAPLLATGAVAGALDENFSNESQLEIWAPDFGDEKGIRLGGEGKGAQGSITVNSRFNRLAWSAPSTSHSKGLLAAGMETGEVNLFDPEKILSGSSADEARIFKSDKHTGPVRGLDFNQIQKNLLLTGAVNAELYIYDLNNPNNAPVPPGPTSTKLNEITSLQWNPTVARVFAASSSSGFTSVWDLKAGKEIVSLQYGGGAAKGMETVGGVAGLQMGKRRGMSDVCWHPENATRLITASEDDESPIIMLWDLRNTRAPEKILSGHHKGVLSVAWCKQDADLLLSCGKDNRTLCWNPSTGEIIGELPASNDWSFQTTWCPRNPDLLATASFDGHIGIHSLQTTSIPSQPAEKFNEEASADDIFGALSQEEPSNDTANVLSLKQPPKWLRRPVSATFGFGGLLATTSNLPGASGKHQSGVVHLRTVTTEQGVIERATALDATAGEKEKLAEFCTDRASGNDDAWRALQTLFKTNSREQLVQLLGFSKEEVVKKVHEAIGKFPSVTVTEEPSEDQTKADAKDESEMATPTVEKTPEEASSVADEIVSVKGSETASTTGATDKSLFDEDHAPGTPAAAAADFFSSMASGTLRNPQLDSIIPHKNNEFVDSSVAATIGSRASSVRDEIITKENTFQIYPEGESDIDKLITQALVMGDFKSAVDLCLASERFADALLLAVRGGPDLLQSTQKAYFARQTASLPFLRVFQSIVTEDLIDIVQNADLREWKVAFVVICTFAKESEFSNLAEQLGQRLQFKWRTLTGSDSPEAKESARIARQDATLCYLAARKLEKVVSIWVDEMSEEEEATYTTRYAAHAQALQSFIEKVAVFTAATGYVDEDLLSPTESAVAAETGARTYKLAGLYDRYYEYADLLATQGLVDIAAKFVKMTPPDYKGTGAAGSELDKARDRLFTAAGIQAGSVSVNSAFGSAKTQPQASTSYAPTSSSSYTPQTAGPYSLAPSSTGPYSAVQPPAPYGQSQPSAYAPPPAPTQNAYKPPTTSAPYQPAQQQQSYGGYGETNPYAPSPVSTYQPAGYSANGYRPNEPQAQGYGAPQQPYGAPPQVIPPPPRAGSFNGPTSNTPPPLPAAQRRDIPGWNDAPNLAPKRPQSAVNKEANKPTAITSPFPNMPNPFEAQPTGFTPPPARQTPQPGVLPPPPKGGPRAPSTQIPPPPRSVASPPAQQQPPPQFQPPPPRGQPLAGPPPTARPPPPQARAGPPPPGVMAGPPPQRALAPLGPGRIGSPLSGQIRPPPQQRPPQAMSPPTQHQAPPPPPMGSRMAGPPPPGRSPSVQHQQQHGGPSPQVTNSPPNPAQREVQPPPAAPAKPSHPAGDRSHISPASRPVFETLSNELSAVKQKNFPPNVKKVVEDTERRLNILFDGLNNDSVPKPALDLLNNITKAIAAKDWNAALAMHVELLTGATGDMTTWVPGVKQLVRLSV
ncbi:protein transporter SEC31 [Kwoniella mangroviensis CBS 10435]|uniref:Protein transport protein SEC31 n=1 Tax=Kwoniella mangroviensis CBS 10435 TaxID=1331196 RepID=A0A1B9IEW4_9TREE|nr:protein transporter SEC31 [Kwoniella mangroviensis CBS 10435]